MTVILTTVSAPIVVIPVGFLVAVVGLALVVIASDINRPRAEPIGYLAFLVGGNSVSLSLMQSPSLLLKLFGLLGFVVMVALTYRFIIAEIRRLFPRSQLVRALLG